MPLNIDLPEDFSAIDPSPPFTVHEDTNAAVNATAAVVDTLSAGSGIPASTVDAKGDLLIGTANDSVGRLPVAANGNVLRVNSATATGLEWGADPLARANHTGTQSADTLTDGTTNKAFLATERTKLTGIATAATANDTDANLKARANHTGSQAISTVTSLQTTLDAKVAASTVDAKGDLLVGTANDNVGRLPVAANGTVLRANSATATGLEWGVDPLARGNHTGSQAISTVTSLQTTLDAKVAAVTTGAKLWIGTQTAYNAIGTKDATTVYAITA